MGSFFVKSAYGKIRESSLKQKEDICKIPWKFKGSQRVRFFIWLVLKQRLFTNTEGVCRGLSHSSACRVCGHTSKDVLYAIRDCTEARKIQNLIIPTDRLRRFYACNLQEWLISNLQNHYDICFGRLIGSVFLGLSSGIFGRTAIFSSFRV